MLHAKPSTSASPKQAEHGPKLVARIRGMQHAQHADKQNKIASKSPESKLTRPVTVETLESVSTAGSCAGAVETLESVSTEAATQQAKLVVISALITRSLACVNIHDGQGGKGCDRSGCDCPRVAATAGALIVKRQHQWQCLGLIALVARLRITELMRPIQDPIDLLVADPGDSIVHAKRNKHLHVKLK